MAGASGTGVITTPDRRLRVFVSSDGARLSLEDAAELAAAPERLSSEPATMEASRSSSSD